MNTNINTDRGAAKMITAAETRRSLDAVGKAMLPKNA